MNNKNDIITPQFQIYNIYDKNNNINETIYEFERCYIKPEIDEIINSGIKNWQQANYKWLIGPEKIEITPDFIRFSMDGANKYTPILSWVAKNNTIENILNTAINITEKFALINNRNLLNRSIKTGNILISSKDNIKIKLFPINLFSDILYGKESIPDEESVLNDMIYLAPEYLYNESTSLKGVAEIYSLGVIFYELFTGITPFKSSEYEELMYSHLFREPVQMIDFNMDITPEISEVISKMLNKSPYDRYSTFNGLLYDLSLCKKYLSDYKKPKEFITGTRDILRTLRIPDKLYGREEHVATMIELFNESKNGSKNTLFISGPSGIGKTFLIKKAIKPLVTTSGIFITGKCKSISKNIPYEPLIEALNQLISPILIEQKEIKNIWKESILKAVGNNGRIITELIPAMEQIIGKQPPLPVLSGEENKNRINAVLLKFLNVFITSARIFILFIDDIQWIDNATLSLLKYIITSKSIKSFLLIAAYRDNEISEFHSLKVFKNEINSYGIPYTEVKLKPLELNSISQMMDETIKTMSENLMLSEMALKYTEGNPLYIKEFMWKIYKEKLLKFEDDTGWQWNSKGIINLYESENFVTTMIDRMNNLPAKTQLFLKYAACIGTSFTPSIISEMMQVNEDELKEIADALTREGFLQSAGSKLRFTHDRVLESAEAIISDKEENALIHYRIGKYLFDSMTEHEHDTNIFVIANHFNVAMEILTPEEKINLMEINFKAGEKARRSAAYELALVYYYKAAGIADKQTLDSEEKIKIYHECFTCEYLNGNYEKAYSLFSLMMNLCKTNFEKVKVYKTNVLLLMHLSKPEMAIDMGLIGLKMLGVKIPKNPGKIELFIEYLKAKFWLQRKNYDMLLSMENITNPYIVMTMELLYTLWMPAYAAYASNKNLMKFLTLKMANLTMKHGLCSTSPFAFITLGIIFGPGKERYSEGYDFGLLALEMIKNEKIINKEVECVINVFFASFHAQWMHSYEYAIPFFKKAQELGTKHGIFYYTRLNRVFYTAARLLKGDLLDSIMKEALEQINNMHHPGNAHWYAIMSMIKNIFYLQEGSIDFFYNDKKFDDSEFLSNLKKIEVKQPLHWFSVFRAKSLLIFKKFNEALRIMETANSVLPGHLSSSIIPEHRFIQSIAIINRTIKKDIISRIRYSWILHKNLLYLKKAAKSCKENYLHKYYIIKAEKNKKRRWSMGSTRYYEMAIKEANKSGLINDLALIYDLQASYSSRLNLNDARHTQLKKAHYYYNQWGAKKKVEELETDYPFLKVNPESDEKNGAAQSDNLESFLTLFEDMLTVLNKLNIPEKSKSISEVLYNHSLGERIILLIKDDNSFSVKSAIDSRGFSFYETGAGSEFLFIDEIIEMLRKAEKCDPYYSDIIFSGDSSTGSFFAAIPVINNTNADGYFIIQKFDKPFSIQDKKIIKILTSMLHETDSSSICRKSKTADLKKDILSSNLNDLIRSRLFKIIEQKKIFRTEELTLTMLAKEIEISPQQLSEYINNNLNMNFNSLINKYRIDEAKKILADEPEKPILNIAYDVGFNSISVFYNAFLKYEGIPPAKFRKNILKEQSGSHPEQ